MKDGKIYTGRIMGETSRSLLLRTPPPDSKSIFLNLREIQTIVREKHDPEKPSEEAGRYATLEVTALGTWHERSVFRFSETGGLGLAAGFRLHPSIELGAGLEIGPSLAGNVSVGDGRTVRGYEAFSAYAGGFQAKFFPLYKVWDSRFEPYVMGGYRWNRLVPQGSGDHFGGSSWLAGMGTRWRWRRHLAWDFRAQVQDISYQRVKFGAGQGDLSGVGYTSVSLGVGLAYLFL